MKKVIVTGATGFIGGALVKSLLDKDVIVYGVGRDVEKLSSFKNDNFIPIHLDMKDFEQLSILVNDEIDVFYHLAWNGGFTTAFKDYELQLENAKYACDAMKYAIEMKVKKFVYGGTINEIEIKQYLNDQTYKPRYTCIHASAKVAGDMICRTLAGNSGEIEYCTALIPMPYGIGNQSPQVLNILMKNCYNNLPTKLIEGNNKYDAVYVEDIAEALYYVGEKGVNMQSYYVGHMQLESFRQNMEFIRDSINSKAELLFGEYPEALDLNYELVDMKALQRDTGFKCPANRKENILATAKWLIDIDKNI